jgi:ParB family chromosome partitioning protein
MTKKTVQTQISLQPPSADAWISPDKISRNPENPRLIFKQKDLDALKQSIYQVGILQPLIVYEPNDSPGIYILIDGERRWRCAHELNLQKVPVHIHPEPNPVQNLTTMFNIHKLRVDWELMPTALALNKLRELTGENRIAELSRMTGLGVSMVRKCLMLLSFSQRHQDMALTHKIKDNLLLEIHPILRSIEKNIPEFLEIRDKDTIIDNIIDKEKKGYLRSVVELRDLQKVVESTNHGAPKPVVQKIIEMVLDKPSFSVASAYSRVRSLYDVQHLTRQFNLLADEISAFNSDGIDEESIQNLLTSLQVLKKQLLALEESLLS